MKLVRLLTIILILASSGCASHRVVMPTMDLPPEPAKPKITATTIMQGDKAFVAYTVPDSLKLYQYLEEEESYTKKLRNRIDVLNQIITGKQND